MNLIRCLLLVVIGITEYPDPISGACLLFGIAGIFTLSQETDMTPTLHLVTPTSRAPAVPHVLSSERADRLARLNDATRALRKLGVRIVGQSVDGEFPADGEPSIRIERNRERPFAPFLDAAGPRIWTVIARDGVSIKRAACVFRGVIVILEEPQ